MSLATGQRWRERAVAFVAGQAQAFLPSRSKKWLGSPHDSTIPIGNRQPSGSQSPYGGARSRVATSQEGRCDQVTTGVGPAESIMRHSLLRNTSLAVSTLPRVFMTCISSSVFFACIWLPQPHSVHLTTSLLEHFYSRAQWTTGYIMTMAAMSHK